MWIEIDLIQNVADIEDLDVVLDQRQRDNQGRELLMIIADHAQQLGFLVSAEPLLEISRMCWSTFTCLRTVAFTANAFMNSSPYR